MIKLIKKKESTEQSLQPYKSFVTVCAARFARLRTSRAKPFGHGFKG